MGKSTVASMLQHLDVPVHDADEEVHRLLGPKGKAALAVAAAFPYFEYPQIYHKKPKRIDRKALGEIVFHDDEKREKLENIVHPLVREAQNFFILKHRKAGRSAVALDIPLLFETGSEQFVDYTINVSAPYSVQRRRVLERPGMDEEKFHAILERQMPDGEKCAYADFIVRTGLGRAHAMKTLKTILQEVRYAV